MTILTIFTAPKPSTDPHVATIQRNALQSWLQLGPEVEVLLIGGEAGIAEAAAKFGLLHLPDAALNQHGTPLVSSIFALARANSVSPLLAYVNADILLMSDFLDAARLVHAQEERFLIVGQRWDLDINTPLDFSPDWETGLRAEVQQRGALHQPAGSDYFIFPRGLYREIPAFAIGRAGWDNWMIYHGMQQPWPVIDATPSLMAVHQNHDYSHMPDGKIHYDSEETEHNTALAGGARNMFMVLDSDKELLNGQIRKPRLRLLRFIRRLERTIQPPDHLRSGPRWLLTRRLRRWRRAVAGTRS